MSKMIADILLTTFSKVKSLNENSFFLFFSLSKIYPKSNTNISPKSNLWLFIHLSLISHGSQVEDTPSSLESAPLAKAAMQ